MTRLFSFLFFHVPLLMMSISDTHRMMKQLGCNVYNRARITSLNVTSEHIIPRSLFGKNPASRKVANHWKNIICCDGYTNSLRSDYRLGDPKRYHDLFIELESMRGEASNTPKRLLTIPPCNYNSKVWSVNSRSSSSNSKIVIDSTGTVSGIVDRQNRVFYPSLRADMGLISRSIIDMLHMTPFLYQQLDLIVADRTVLYEYYDLPKSELELSREALFLEE